MKNKQTALMWLESKLNSIKPTDFCSIETVRDWVNQAKAMEKEQIMDAFGEKRQFIGFDDNESFGIKEVTGEEYYNETYEN